MTDQLNGLRFDIYERVHLPDDVAAIEELEEIELVPHMQVLPQDDQVLLRGHLLLNGVYRSQELSEVSQLEHWIPVEISLPLNRIQSVEELAVEIDNFDVDLISNRSLNVTGVLALRGLQAQAPQTPIWRDDSFTVVHQAEPELETRPEDQLPNSERSHDELALNESDSLASDDYVSAVNADLDEKERVDDWSLQAETEELPLEASKESSWLAMFQNLEESRKDTRVYAEPEEEKPITASLWGDLTNEAPAESDPQPYVEEAIEEKPDLRVALGGKPLESVQQQQFGVGLLSQLGEKGAKREADLKLMEAAQAEEKAQAMNNIALSAEDELEWTSLFLNNGGEAHSFRKVKMCIVQREETLELIANRYNVQSRELQLYNRLHDPYLSEGQVLYIP
ncbi:LysM peptidoglycan-binding domain-containing protein [Cohnella sp.]|uniref:LysM peptidoglycan-binding domain-containing protein n=1 Tax=Cohnella sp. TaxID=1883426 RepID=UPI00356A9279